MISPVTCINDLICIRISDGKRRTPLKKNQKKKKIKPKQESLFRTIFGTTGTNGVIIFKSNPISFDILFDRHGKHTRSPGCVFPFNILTISVETTANQLLSELNDILKPEFKAKKQEPKRLCLPFVNFLGVLRSAGNPRYKNHLSSKNPFESMHIEYTMHNNIR